MNTSGDDNASHTSSMEDSTYMSQTGSGLKASKSRSLQKQHASDAKNSVFDLFSGSDLMSPSLSSGSHDGYSGVHSELSNMMLPPSVGETDYIDDQFNFTNYQGQSYSNYTLFPLQDQNSKYFPQATEQELGQENWQTETQTFSQPFVGSVDAYSYPTMTSNNRRTFSQPTAFMSPKSATENFEAAPSPSTTHRRAHARKTSSHTQASQEHMSRPYLVKQMSTNEAVIGPMDHTTIMSPSSNTIVSGGYLDNDFIDDQSAFLKLNSGTNNSTTGSVIEGAFADEDAEEALYNEQGSLEEADGKMARTHPLYQATPGDDDLYHCPKEGQAGCTHKPTKLKCNYDKYVDSHLRPFRCKAGSCIGVQFSSTACLLRHEREAHGMHGHGSKPHLCSYPDCERSIPGNGFPRRYNLFDHMKRVHDFTGSTTPPEQASPPAVTPVIAAKRPNPRKRKSTGAVEETVSEKRHKPLPTKSASTPAVPVISAETRRAMERQQLDAEWTKLKTSIIQRIQELPSLTDMAAHEAAAGEWSAIYKIAQRAHELG